MNYEWDPDKQESNRRKHGIDFADVDRFVWEAAVFTEDTTAEGEPRDCAVGFLDDKVVVVVYTMRGDSCRIIMMRPANKPEMRNFAGA